MLKRQKLGNSVDNVAYVHSAKKIGIMPMTGNMVTVGTVLITLLKSQRRTTLREQETAQFRLLPTKQMMAVGISQ